MAHVIVCVTRPANFILIDLIAAIRIMMNVV
jgi:hypothetical protein